VSRLIDAVGETRAQLDLLHPGPGLSFVGPHRRIPGGFLTAEGHLLRLDGVRAATWTDAGLLLAWRIGPRRLQLAVWTGEELQIERQMEANGVRLGLRWLSAWNGGTARVEVRTSGRPVRVPLGLRGGHCLPDAPGLIHAEGRALLRVDGAGATTVAGVVGGAIKGLFVGPRGSAIGWSTAGAFSLSTSRGPRPLALDGPLLAASFSADGTEALVEDAEGVFRVDLSDGSLVGFQPDLRVAGWPRLADLAGGLHDWSDDGPDLAALPGPGVVVGDRLHGPGGLCWDLRTAEAVDIGLTAGVDLAVALDADAVVLVDDQDVLLRTEAGGERALTRLDDDDTPLELLVGRGPAGPFAVLRSSRGVSWGGATASSWRHHDLLLPTGGPLLSPTVDGGILAPSAEGDILVQGRVPPRPAPPSPALAPGPGSAAPALLLGLPLDGHTRAPDGRIWAWQDDGVLVRLSPR